MHPTDTTYTTVAGDRGISRRRFAWMVAATGLTARYEVLRAQTSGIVAAIRAQAAADPISVTSLRAGLHVLSGSGGNVVACIGREGTVLSDSGIAVSRAKIERALASLGSRHVDTVVNTHWHFDHTSGNAWLRAAGATIIGHPQTRVHMAKATRVEGWQFTFEASPPEALPTQFIEGRTRLTLSAGAVDVEPIPPAHTDSDVRVSFPDADVLHAGDIWWNGYFPFIDYSTGGSIDGTIAAVESLLRVASAKTIIVPGHGPIGAKADLSSFLEMLTSIRHVVADAKQRGRTLAEVRAARPTRAFDAAWGGYAIDGDAFTALVYAGV